MAGIDLMPPSYYQRQRRRGRKKWLVLMVIVLLALGVYQGMEYFQRWQFYRREVAQLQADLELVRPFLQEERALREKEEAVSQRRQLLQGLEALRLPWADLVEEVREIAGPDISLRRIAFTPQGDVTVEGEARRLHNISSYLERMENVESLRPPRLELARREEGGRYYFVLETRVREARDAE